MIDSVQQGAERLSGLAEVPRQRKKCVRQAAMALGTSMVSFSGAESGLAAVAATLHAVADKGLQDDEEDGYYSTEEEDEVDEEVAAKGLGEAGSVHLADSIWNSCVPKDLKKKYETHMKEAAQEIRGKPEAAVGAMLESVRVITRGTKRTSARRTVSVFLKPKNEEKCRLILNPKVLHGADRRRPPRFILPRLEQLGRWIAGLCGVHVYLTKLDLQNCYWSIRLPRGWRRMFVIGNGRKRYRITRLPFGWRYSPVICQKLVQRLVAKGLRKVRALAWTYLDDVLMAAKSRKRAKKAHEKVAKVLRKAGFIINTTKSISKPSRTMEFVGKIIDTKKRTIENKKGTLVAATRAWLKAVAKRWISEKQARSMLGKVGWATRPSGGAGAFVAGAHAALHKAQEGSGIIDFNARLAKSVGTAVLLAHIPHSFEPVRTGGWTLFSDAAEDGDRFRVGIVGLRGLYKSVLCPTWIESLQQAELFGIYLAAKLAIYIQRNAQVQSSQGGGVMIGTDSEVGRFQVLRTHAASSLGAQQRILRRMFWLRSWSGYSVGVFRVGTRYNPADPLSRVHEVGGKKAAKERANGRVQEWRNLTDPYRYLSFLPPAHWRRH